LSESDLNNVSSGAFVSGDNIGSYGPQCVGGGLQIVFLMVDRRQGRAYTDLPIFSMDIPWSPLGNFALNDVPGCLSYLGKMRPPTEAALLQVGVFRGKFNHSSMSAATSASWAFLKRSSRSAPGSS
jgi:hypothetical protein